jgi:hypothetical protein
VTLVRSPTMTKFCAALVIVSFAYPCTKGFEAQSRRQGRCAAPMWLYLRRPGK